MNDPLILPVGLLARPIEPLNAEDSLERAIRLLPLVTSSVLPIVQGETYIGAISEYTLQKVLEEGGGQNRSEAVEKYADSWPTIPAHATGAEAIRLFAQHNTDTLIVLDANGIPVAVLSPSDMFEKRVAMQVPPLVGGMATPFGVYLTSGVVNGGVGGLALFSTGALLLTLFLLSDIVTYFAALSLPEQPWAYQLVTFLPAIVFFALMRMIPLSGVHAAEHMVVHALERGENLRPEVIKRMPRVHPRCGTNIAVAASIFLTIFSWEWVPDQQVRLLVAAMVTLFSWRFFGGLVQYWITTKPPTSKQIESGISAAKDLLEKYQINRRQSASPLHRILQSGILHVMAGSATAALVAHFIAEWLKLPFAW